MSGRCSPWTRRSPRSGEDAPRAVCHHRGMSTPPAGDGAASPGFPDGGSAPVGLTALALRLRAALGEDGDPLARAAAIVRDAFDVDRASVARIDERAGSFEIAAEAGEKLLAPGTALPLTTCSYFAEATSGHAFGETDFDGSTGFRRPVDEVILAAGFHSGCSAPIRHEGRTVGALSLSACGRRSEMESLARELSSLTGALAPGLGEASTAPPGHVLVCSPD